MKNRKIEIENMDTEALIKKLGGEVVELSTDSMSYFNPFDIDEKYSRQDVLSRIKALVVIANKGGEIVNVEFIKELANKNNFEITDDEIYNILNS